MPKQRREYILRLLEQRGHLRSAELARELGVTEETVRTDFVALEKKQLLQRLHGGARYRIPPRGGLDGDTRLATQMAEAARKLILPGDCVFLEDGLYSRSLIALLGDLPCCIVCNSPSLLKLLSPAAQVQDIMALGGKLDKATGLLGGALALAQLEQLSIDKLFLSPASMGQGSIAYHRPAQAELARALMGRAKACYMMVSSSAFTAKAAYEVAPYRCDMLIAEDALPADWPEMPTQLIPYIPPVIAEEGLLY